MSFTGIPDDPRRRATRHRTELPSDIGDVLDLSKTGMRVGCKGKPQIKQGVIRKVKLRTAHGVISVMGRAVWVKRTGFRKYEIGIDFLQVKPTIAAALAQIAEFGFIGAGKASTGEPASPFGGRASGGAQEKQAVRAAVQQPDYYGILGISPDASDEEIHAAYRAMARRYHPDTTTEPDGEAKFIEVSEAYEVLKDPAQRKAYGRRHASAA